MNELKDTSLTPKPSIFTLGASGFVGQYVWKTGAERKYLQRALQRHGQVDSTHGTVISGDLSSFKWKNLDQHPPDAIIHTARISGQTAIGRWFAGWQGLRANEALERWRLGSGVRLVYASGTLVYGDCGSMPVVETNPLSAISFQRNYIRAEKPFLDRVHVPKSGLCIARLPWIYGPGSWLAQFYIRTARRDGFVTQFGSGRQIMSLLHVEDAAGMMLDLAVNREASGVFNLTTGISVTHNDFCEMVASALNLPIKNLSDAAIWSKYGKTVGEALTFSSNLQTERDEIRQYPLRYPDTATGISKVVSQLESQMQLKLE